MQHRRSGVELLRILSMMLIVMAHVAGLGGFLRYSPGFNGVFAHFTCEGGKYASSILVLLGASFACERGTRFRSLFHIVFCAFFIQLSCVLLRFGTFASTKEGVLAIFKSFFPISSTPYWFVTTYVILLLFSPVLNLIVHGVSKRGYHALLLVATYVFSIPYTLHLPSNFYTFNDLAWFVYLYLVMGYFMRFPPAFAARWNRMLLCGMAAYLLMFLLDYAFKTDYYSQHGSLLMAVSALCVTLAFRAMPMRYCPAVNFIARGSFTVYLVHCSPLLIFHYWWYEVFRCNLWWSERWYPLAALGIACFFFAVSIPLDALCRWLEKQLFRLPCLKRLACWADERLARRPDS